MTTADTREMLDHPTRMVDQAPQGRSQFLIGATVGALVLSLAGLGVALWALVDVPTAGPTGATGAMGATGARGSVGAIGKTGAAGPAGPAGTVRATEVVSSTALVSAPDVAVGTVLVATTTCPSGKVLLGGGAQVSATGLVADRHIELRSSYPLTADSWRTISMVTGKLGTGETMSMKPYVMCGIPTPTSTTTQS